MSLSGSAAPRTWEEVLDRLELDVETTLAAASERNEAADEALQAVSEDTSWIPTTDLGPVPPWLRTRAAALLERQYEAQRILQGAATSTHRQRDFAARVSAATAFKPTPAYIDVTA